MLSILKKDPHSIDRANQWGQTPLHLAVGWPLGVSVLLNNRANVDARDQCGDTPLHYALRGDFAETLDILMRAGCDLDHCVLGRAILAWKSPQDETSLKRREAALTIFINALAERRRRLRRSLATVPILEGMNACWAQNDRVLDEHASCAEDAVKYFNITPSQGSTQLYGLRTVYHVECLTVKIAEELWQAGFRDIDVPDRFGQTPLSCYRNYYREASPLFQEIELVNWLVERGASIYRPIRSHSHFEPITEVPNLQLGRKAMHHIAANIGRLICKQVCSVPTDPMEEYPSLPSGFLSRLNERSRQMIKTNFHNALRDSCLCACSFGGCTISTILHKWIYDEFPPRGKTIYSLEATRLLMTLLGPHDTFEDWFINEIIRFNTFQELQLRHTCCKHRFWSEDPFTDPEPSELHELRDEDSEGIKLLEELMIEFQHERGDQSCMEFLEGYWTARMAEVHRTRGKVDIEKTREIGVVWNESSEEDDFEEASSVEELSDDEFNDEHE